MDQYEYTEVEMPLIDQLKSYGYTHLSGAGLDSERNGRGSVVLEARLAAAIKRLNNWMSDANMEKVVKQLVSLQAEDLWHTNKTMYDWLFGQGISVMQDLGSGKKNQTVQLFDFENVQNNEFLAVNQISYTNANGTIRPDLVLYINGLPLILVECKSPKLKWDKQLPEGVRQFERYQGTNEKLFWYNQMLIVTSRDRARVGTIFARPQHYGLWKDPYPLTLEEVGGDRAQDIMAAGMLRKESILDLMRNFIVFDGKVKKLSRYQQYRAVNKGIQRIVTEKKPALRGGVVWHTQGSGKSLTMVYMAMKLRRVASLQNPMLVIVTDRQDLDEQITKTFQNCGFPNPTQAVSVADLKRQLERGPGATVMTLIQKFQGAEDDAGNPVFPVISEAENIIVMTDESHRSQYKGLALNMRKALPNATFIGFTGTPIEKEKRSTTGKFGSYIDKYTIEQAVKDGATVPIHYESRLPNVHVKGDSLDELFNRVFFEYDEDTREKIKQKHVNESLILTAPERMDEIALDIIRHFESRILVNGYKAQVVCVSRIAAVRYKALIDQYAAGQFETAVIFSGGHNDEKELRNHHITKEQEKELINRFKKPFSEDKLAMLIVCDKLLTGFDAPIEQVMYLDKPLREHNLLQAIARTNRKYDDNKSYGLIVDYFGVSRFLDEALEIFSANDVKGALQSIDEELPRLEQRHRSAMRYFDGLKKTQREDSILRLKEEDVRTEFDIAYKRFAESMDKVMPSPKAEKFVGDLKHLGMIRQLAKSRFSVEDGMDISDCGEKVRELIYKHLQSEGIQVRKPVSILDAAFKEDVEENVKPETKAAQIEHAIKREISVKMEEDEVFYTSLKEKVQELIERFKERQMDIYELLDKLYEAREELVKKAEGKTNSGLTSEQEPYYNKLMEVFEDTRPDTELKEIAIEVQQFIDTRVSPISDWTSKADFKRELNADMKIMFLKKKMSMPDASMLVGYFTALAEVQYK
ncbi:type I restriction endonuclease subunit R [Bacillus infantis]|uniref:type I restriction endonuclease subunit R n=1 Tax=Bacillus infantis TaxID=324767 RepID=UPI001CD1B72F|nr:type I restriction endonuclease subunit R [Bacillus infantis]MCA1037499.1 type I restriction endonuclease subunit R [Bacillus infantis]HER2025528.1 type I restriction endonuclease subunit R [Streptococcus pyogenes]